MGTHLDPEREQERLDRLEQKIDEARQAVDDGGDGDGDGEPDFIDRGTVATDQVDNAIAPPG
jgi:hypothetical protein